ncbi:MAG: M15 family metallopeptidase [Ruminococcaceae bacterium]|nr:M15 family metallopeptidase [Oscillospiraceae bacterium]
MNTIYLTENDVFKGNLILVNEDYPVHENEISDLTAVSGSEIVLRHKAALQLNSAITAVNGNTGITPVSGYRSMEEQRNIWNDCLAESGMEFTEKYVARPAHSEHQTGLAIDLGITRRHIDFIRPEFPDDGICGKFKAVSAKYGFILRYPSDKEHITRIAYEPWHFRYVGAPHAELVQKNGFVLEEYIEYIKRFKFGINPLDFQNKCEISYLAAGDYSLDATDIIDVSGNNHDGFIITKRSGNYE